MSEGEIDAQVDTLLRRQRNREQAKIDARVKRRAEVRAEMKERLLAGDTARFPHHLLECRACLRALVSLRHDEACHHGKQHISYIVVNSEDLTKNYEG